MGSRRRDQKSKLIRHNICHHTGCHESTASLIPAIRHNEFGANTPKAQYLEPQDSSPEHLRVQKAAVHNLGYHRLYV